jgi:NADH-quinone oxidoreductase subunit L
MNLPFGNLHFLAEWLHESVVNAHVPEAGEGFSLRVAAISTGAALLAIGLSWFIYGQKPLAAGQADPLSASGPLFTFLNRKWLWDETYALLIIRPYNALARFLADVVDWQFWHNYVHDTIITNGFYNGWSRILSQPIDKGLVDGAFNGLASLINGSSKQLRRTQTGYVRNYALAVAFGVVLVLAFLVYQFLK